MVIGPFTTLGPILPVITGRKKPFKGGMVLPWSRQNP
jgi:hypothetical protein